MGGLILCCDVGFCCCVCFGVVTLGVCWWGFVFCCRLLLCVCVSFAVLSLLSFCSCGLGFGVWLSLVNGGISLLVLMILGSMKLVFWGFGYGVCILFCLLWFELIYAF